MKRNNHLTTLKNHYLFPEVHARKQQFLANHPDAELISLGIGDTTEPLAPSIAHALAAASSSLADATTYTGYGPEQGSKELREKIASKIYGGLVTAEEIFISDGAKCDIGRLQLLFGNAISVAVQDPTYPAYVDSSLIRGVKKIIPMRCCPKNHFFPHLQAIERTDLIYFCSPNNPTGATATRSQLQELVSFAKANRSIIIFDSAYASYIQDPLLPKSIFEIEGAQEVAIEISSFSKLAGFTGVRLGWSVFPEKLTYDDGSSVKADWHRVICTVFNGASNIAQAGGCAALEEKGLQEIASLMQFYLENGKILRETLESIGYEVFGGLNAPYLWMHFPGRRSWEVFQQFLEQLHIVTTPGVGFGSAGEGFIRLAAFGHRANILKAAERLQTAKLTIKQHFF